MNLAEFPLTVLPVLLFPDDALLLLLLKIVFPTSLFLALSYLPLFLPLHFLLKKLQDPGKNLPVLWYLCFFSYLPAAVALKDCLQLHQKPFFPVSVALLALRIFYIPPFPWIYQVHLVSPSYPDLPFPVSYEIYTGRSI